MEGFAQQVIDRRSQVDTLKTALHKLQQKLEEARGRSHMLIAEHRRARTMGRAADARTVVNGTDAGAAFDRMKNKVMRETAIGQAKTEVLEQSTSVEDRFAKLEKEDQVNRILGELKAKRGALTSGSGSNI
jgi:phage shock protein A